MPDNDQNVPYYMQPAPPRNGWGQPPPVRRRRRWPWIVAIIVAVAFIVGSCQGGGAGVKTVGSVPGPTLTSHGGPARAIAIPKPSTSKLPKGVHRFGETIEFKDGTTLTVAAPKKFTPDQYADGDDQHAAVKIKLTLKNGTGQLLDPSLTSGSASSGDTEGDSIYQDGLDAPDNKILPGHSVTWWMGYSVKSAAHLTFTVDVGFLDYPSETFTNEV